MNLTVVSLDDATWPGPLTGEFSREASSFTASWSDTLGMLDTEVDLTANGGKYHASAVLEVAFPKTKLYADGSGVHANARNPRHPGVTLSFDIVDVGPVRFATDRYTARGYGDGRYLCDWQSNVRAIALTLRALRAVDRYGATRSAEQYRGWAALSDGEATPLGSGPLTLGEAAAVLADASGIGVVPEALIGDLPGIKAAYREAARQMLDPDLGGSADPAVMALVTRARDALLEAAS